MTQRLLRSCVAALCMLTLIGPALAERISDPVSRTAGVKPVTLLPTAMLPAVDAEARLNEDAATTKPGPLRYAIPVDMSVTPDTAGTWENLADGSRLWRYRVHAPGATDLNFGFTRYRLPEGATLHVISEKQDYYHGPYTHEDNRDHGQHWTPMVPGDSAVVELYLPAKVAAAGDYIKLELGRVGTGYRDLFGKPNLTRQGACNIDTICPEGDNWRDEIRSAGMYSRGGSFVCSGTLIMDVPGSFRPWWLTADHCGMTAGNAASMVVLWNFESAVCGDLSGGVATDSQSGSTWRSARADADFTLLELSSEPPGEYGVFYSGWDATGTVPQSSMGISHPSTDEKALAINLDPLTTTASCIGSTTPGTHWRIENYELGMTEPGSSGSGLWNPYGTDPLNPNDPKLVGVLSGGLAACFGTVPNDEYDCYGKFSVAYNDSEVASQHLVSWLDPGNTGTLMVNGADPFPAVCGDSAVGAGEQCDDGNTGNGDGCSSVCSIEPGYSCTNPPDSPSVCVLIECGNGIVETGEQCDDGNVSDSDGCSSLCEIEDGFTCSNLPGDPSICLPIPAGCSLPNLSIPDSTPAGVSDDVGTGSTGTLVDLDVSLDVSHTWVGDLIVTLEHVSTGTTAVLIDRPGVPAISTVGCSNSDIDVTLDDAASTAAEDQCSGTPPAIGGTHSPSNPLAVFNGEDASGTWRLNISDNVGADLGTLNEWCLIATVDDPSPDADEDGVPDSIDNCTDVPNPDQYDSNGDGIGSLCDPDVTNDCFVNNLDLLQMKAAFFTNPTSPNWNPDLDLDNSGVINNLDLLIMKQFFFAAPGPSANSCNQ